MSDHADPGIGDSGPAARPRTYAESFPGRLDQVRQARAAVADFLGGCPVADDVVTMVSELASNAVSHSGSGLLGGRFAVRVEDFPGTYVYAEVTDGGSGWHGDLDKSAECPHGLYILQKLATTYGAGRRERAWSVWFTADYPRHDHSSGEAAAKAAVR